MKKILSILFFIVSISLPFIAYTAEQKETINIYGYEDTIVMLRVDNKTGACKAIKFKTNESEEIITCSDAIKIINTFPNVIEMKK